MLLINSLQRLSHPRLATLVDGDRRTRGIGHLHAMFLAAEVVGDIPVAGSGLAGLGGATLDVLGRYLLPVAITAHVGTDHGPGHCTTGSRQRANSIERLPVDQSWMDQSGIST